MESSSILPEYECGDIVYVEIPDPTGGNTKDRPVIVIDPPTAGDSRMLVVAVTDITNKDRNSIALPWSTDGHPETGLVKDCVAKLSRASYIDSTIVRRVAGRIPKKLLLEIVRRLILPKE